MQPEERELLHQPLAAPELLERMAQDPTLVRRPIIVAGEELMVGFNPRRLQEILG